MPAEKERIRSLRQKSKPASLLDKLQRGKRTVVPYQTVLRCSTLLLFDKYVLQMESAIKKLKRSFPLTKRS
jgi:hypothetical protein